MTDLGESIMVEDAVLFSFGKLGYAVVNGPNTAPGELTAERVSYGVV